MCGLPAGCEYVSETELQHMISLALHHNSCFRPSKILYFSLNEEHTETITFQTFFSPTTEPIDFAISVPYSASSRELMS